MTSHTNDGWYFDLKAGRAVSGDERGPAKDLLGPYPSKEAAENWRATHDAREDAWDDGDDDRGDDAGEEGEADQPA
jgi:hypothetical protein